MTSHWNRIEVLYGCTYAEVLLADSVFGNSPLIFRRGHHPIGRRCSKLLIAFVETTGPQA